MIAGISWIWWVGFHVVVAALLMAGSLLQPTADDSPPLRDSPASGGAHGSLQGRWHLVRRPLAFAWLWTTILLVVAICFAAWIAMTQGRQTALEFAGGYAIETSLSVDNLFVF